MRYTELKNTRSEFLSVTGLTVEEFEHYLPSFTMAYGELYPPPKTIDGRPRQRRSGSGVPGALAHMEDKLLFIWMYRQVHTARPALGLHFGLSHSQINYWIHRLLPVLALTFSKLKTIDLQPNCVQFLQLLNTCQVEYLVIGGHAVAFHGYLRPILDLDIFIATHPTNAEKMVQVLQAFGPGVTPQTVEFFQMEERTIRIGQPPFTVERFAPDDRFIHLGVPPTQLEIITSISAVTFAECYPERVAAVISDVPVQVIGLTHLKRNKQASIRPKDADDLAHLS